MAEIVNLRRARKAKVRREKESEARDNRVRFGTTKAARQLASAQEEAARRRLDGHLRQPDDDEPEQ